MNTVSQLSTLTRKVQSKVEAELGATGGLLRLAPAWVPRSFLQPGLRLKLHPDDTYAYGANRGGIDERCRRVHSGIEGHERESVFR